MLLTGARGKSESVMNYINAGNAHSKLLIPQIDITLKSAGIEKKKINLIVCGVGPGSFTGIRVAVTTARMMAQLLEIPVMPLPTQKIFALCAGTDGDIFATALDAKKGRVFAAAYRINGNSADEVAAPGDYFPEDFAAAVSGKGRVVFAGSGSEKFAGFFSQIAGAEIKTECKFVPERIFSHIETNLKTENYSMLAPLYIRKSDAEVAKLTASLPADARASAK